MHKLKWLSCLLVIACGSLLFGQARSHSARLKAYTAVLPAGAGTPANGRQSTFRCSPTTSLRPAMATAPAAQWLAAIRLTAATARPQWPRRSSP